jgi:hypothetical protein
VKEQEYLDVLNVWCEQFATVIMQDAGAKNVVADICGESTQGNIAHGGSLVTIEADFSLSAAE